MNPNIVKKSAFFFYLIFFVTGIGTMVTGLPFPFSIGDERTASFIYLGISLVFLIIYYVFKLKTKKQS